MAEGCIERNRIPGQSSEACTIDCDNRIIRVVSERPNPSTRLPAPFAFAFTKLSPMPAEPPSTVASPDRLIGDLGFDVTLWRKMVFEPSARLG